MPAVPDTSVQMSKKRRKLFLQVLSKTGKVSEAARCAGYADTSFLVRLRKQDEDFAAEWDIALEAAKHQLEEEAIRRATEGVLEPVFYKGSICGYKTNYSDSLLMFILRKLDPSYRDSAQRGDTNINFGIAVLPMQAQDEGAWEQRALEMHGNQQVIELEAKPTENTYALRDDSSMQRGD